MKTVLGRALLTLAVIALLLPAGALAKPNMELDSSINKSLMKFKAEIKGGDEILTKAKGYLIFPEVTKVGLGVGYESGEGALYEDGKFVSYYKTRAASIGAQVGAQTKAMVIAFMTEDALTKFKNSAGWEAGVDGKITIAEIGVDGSINTTKTMQQPILAYVYGAKGLMADISLSGSKFTKLEG